MCELSHNLPNDLRLKIVGRNKNFKKIPKMLGNEPKRKILTIVLENCQKPAAKHFVHLKAF